MPMVVATLNSVLESAEAGPGAEMSHHRASAAAVALPQNLRDVLIREAMKSVAAHAALLEFNGNRENAIDAGLRRMKRRVEAPKLANARRSESDKINRRQACRLMQGGERLEPMKNRDRYSGQVRRPSKLNAAMHDAMPYAGQH